MLVLNQRAIAAICDFWNILLVTLLMQIYYIRFLETKKIPFNIIPTIPHLLNRQESVRNLAKYKQIIY